MDIVSLNKKRIFFKVIIYNIILFAVFIGISYLIYTLTMREPLKFIKIQQKYETLSLLKFVDSNINNKNALMNKVTQTERNTPFKVYIFDNESSMFNRKLDPELKNYLLLEKGANVYDGALYFTYPLNTKISGHSKDAYITLEYPKKLYSKLTEQNFKYAIYKGLALYIIIAFIVTMTTIIISMINVDKFQTKIFGDLIKQTDDGVIITDGDGNIIYSNQSFLSMFELSLGKLLGRNISQFNSAMHDEEFFKGMLGRLNREGVWEGEVINKKKNGTKVFSDLRLTKIVNKESDESFFIGIYRDKTSSRDEKIDMLRLQLYDNFTGLPNKTYAFKYIDKLISSKVDFASLIISIENFKAVNIQYGTDTGDKVLLQFVEKVKDIFSNNTFISRIDGRKLGIIVEELELSKLSSFIKSVSELADRAYSVFNENVKLEINIGKSIYPEEVKNIDEIFSVDCIPAEKLAVENYTDNVNIAITKKEQKIRLITSLMEKAIDNNEFSMKFQPRVDSNDNTLIGGEALIRWENKELGNVSPMYFIPLAEKSGFISKITDWTLSELCSKVLEWKTKNLNLVPISLNISPIEFKNNSFAEQFIKKFNNYKLSPENIQLELTEGALNKHFNEVRNQINELWNQGFNVLIDNFGTGNSKLNYLKELNISMLKIDREFIRNYPEKDDGTTVKVIINTAKSFGLEVVGEGAENLEQINFLRSSGCHFVQGYYYSKPVTSEEFILYLKAEKINPV